MQTWNHKYSLSPSSWSFIELLLCAQHCAIFHLYNSVPMLNIFPLAYYHTQFIDKFVTNPPQLVPNKNPFLGFWSKRKMYSLIREWRDTTSHIWAQALPDRWWAGLLYKDLIGGRRGEVLSGHVQLCWASQGQGAESACSCWEGVWVHQLCTRNSVQVGCTQHESSTCVPFGINETRLSTKRIKFRYQFAIQILFLFPRNC